MKTTISPPKFAKNPPVGLLSVFSVVAEPEKENFGASLGTSSFFSAAAAPPPPKLNTGGFFASVAVEEEEEAPNEKDGFAGSTFWTGDFGAVVVVVGNAAAGGGGVGDFVSLTIELLLLGTISASTHFVS